MRTIDTRRRLAAENAAAGLRMAIQAVREIYYLDRHHREVPPPRLSGGYGGMLEDLDQFEHILVELAKMPVPKREAGT